MFREFYAQTFFCPTFITETHFFEQHATISSHQVGMCVLHPLFFTKQFSLHRIM